MSDDEQSKLDAKRDYIQSLEEELTEVEKRLEKEQKKLKFVNRALSKPEDLNRLKLKHDYDRETVFWFDDLGYRENIHPKLVLGPILSVLQERIEYLKNHREELLSKIEVKGGG